MPNRLGLPCTYPTLSSYPILGQAQGHSERCLHLQEASCTPLLSSSLLLFSFPSTLLTLLDPQEDSLVLPITGSQLLYLLPRSSFPPTFHPPRAPLSQTSLLAVLHAFTCVEPMFSCQKLSWVPHPSRCSPEIGRPSQFSLCLLLSFFYLSSYLFHSMATNRVDKFSPQSLFLFPTPLCPVNNSPWHLPWLCAWCQRDKVKGTRA